MPDHSHSHSTTSAAPTESASVQFANDMISQANSALEKGAGVDDISAGLRHAAANFSAFACTHTAPPENADEDPLPGQMVEEFARMLSYYLDVHKPQTQPQTQPADGLKNLIEQVKNES